MYLSEIVEIYYLCIFSKPHFHMSVQPIDVKYKLKTVQRDALSFINHHQPSSHGYVLNVDMGKGKTIAAITAFMSFRDIRVCIFSPQLSVQWSDALEKFASSRPVAVQSGMIIPVTPVRAQYTSANNVLWCMYNYSNLVSFIKQLAPDNVGNVCYVFDECHKLSETLLGVPELYLTRISKSYRSLALTGTLVYSGITDFLFAYNLTVGPDQTGVWPFDWTSREFVRRFRKTKMGKSALQAWFVGMLVLQVGVTPVLIKMLDILDFYATKDRVYLGSKKELIASLVTNVPGFDTDVLDGDAVYILKKKSLISVLSMMLFFGLMSPFSAIVPSMIGIFALKQNSDVYDLNYSKVAKIAAPHVFRRMIKYTNEPFAQRHLGARNRKWARRIDGVIGLPSKMVASLSTVQTSIFAPRNPRDTVLNTMHVHKVSISYNLLQTQMFTRLTTDSAVPLDYVNLGITLRETLSLKQLMHEGLIIGNLTFTEKDVATIKAQIKSKTKNRPKINIKIDSILEDGELKVEHDDTTTFRQTVTDNVSSPKSPKFEYIRKNILIPGANKQVLVYSNFVENGLMKFAEYFPVYTMVYYLLNYPDEVKMDGVTADEQRKDALLRYKNKTAQILMLGPEYTEGVDGIKGTEIMLILEPLPTLSKLRQLRARAVRNKSHCESPAPMTNRECLDASPVQIYELSMSLTFIKANLWNSVAQKEWFANNRAVPYFMRTVLFDQSTVPDELVLEAQAQGVNLSDALDMQTDRYEKANIDFKQPPPLCWKLSTPTVRVDDNCQFWK
jgi:hypothetical protein